MSKYVTSPGRTNFIDVFSKHDALDDSRDILLTLVGKYLNGDNVTLLDLFNIKGLKNDNEIETFINNVLSENKNQKIDISTNEGLSYVNKLLNESINFYEDELYRKYPKRKLKISFKSKKEIIDFLKGTLKGDVYSEIICMIGKIAYGINDILDNKKLQDLDKKACFMIGKKIIPNISLDDYDFFNTFGIGTGSIKIGDRVIKFKLRYRGKESNKSVIKLLNDPKYMYSDLIADSIGIEFEVFKEKDAFLILNYFYNILFVGLDDSDNEITNAKNFKNKKLLSIKKFEKLIDKGFQFSETFFNFIMNGIEKDGFEDKNNKNYKDARFEGNTFIPIDITKTDSQVELHSVELRTALIGNKNEEGLADHNILDMLKVIFTIIRLTGYIREGEIKKLINIVLDENPELITKKGLNKDMIFNYYIKEKLLKIQHGKKILYTTKNRFKTLIGTSFYPIDLKKIED